MDAHIRLNWFATFYPDAVRLVSHVVSPLSRTWYIPMMRRLRPETYRKTSLIRQVCLYF